MSSPAASARSRYGLYGLALEVTTDQPQDRVLETIDLRLRGFGHPGAAAPADLRLEFSTDGISTPDTVGRPIYETRDGSLGYLPGCDLLAGRLGEVRFACEASRGLTRLAAPRFSGRTLYLAAHPLVTIALMEMLERRGLFALHAACLATDAGHGLLIAGPSGAGKSTLAIALARAGMPFLADDTVFLETGATASVRALGFADAVGLTGHAARSFPELRPLLEHRPPAGFPKRLHRIDALVGAPSIVDCTPRTLVFPELTPGRPSEIAPLDPGQALVRLVPDVLVTAAASTQAHLDAIGALLDQVRCYRLASGDDLQRTAALVREVA